MPAPEPPAAPNRPSDGPWPGPEPPGPEPPADIGSAREAGLASPATCRRSAGGRDDAQHAEPAERTAGSPPPKPLPAPPLPLNVSVSSDVVVDVPAQRRRGRRASCPRLRCGRRLRRGAEGRGGRLGGGRCALRRGVVAAAVATRRSAGGGRPTGAGGWLSAGGCVSGGGGGGSGGGAGSAGGGGVAGTWPGLRRRIAGCSSGGRNDVARDGSVGTSWARAPGPSHRRERERQRGEQHRAATGATVVGLTTSGLGRTAASTERHLHLIGLKLETRPCRGTQSPRDAKLSARFGRMQRATDLQLELQNATVDRFRFDARRRRKGCAVARPIA